jgi:hypothetical protein
MHIKLPQYLRPALRRLDTRTPALPTAAAAPIRYVVIKGVLSEEEMASDIDPVRPNQWRGPARPRLQRLTGPPRQPPLVL